MLVTAAALGFLGVAAASPIACDAPAPAPKPTTSSTPQRSEPDSSSKGFSMYINVTDQSRELASSVHGKFINGIHTGAAQNLVGPGSDSNNARVFYQNGTLDDPRLNDAHMLSDLGTPSSPFGLYWTMDVEGSYEDPSTAHLNAGPGNSSNLIGPAATFNHLFTAICNVSVDYYQGKKMSILKQFSSDNPPEECVPVTLIAQCAELKEPEKGSFANHDSAQEVPCYKDVSAVNWSQ